jgi:5-methyltetrahydrofolate--homocysteine methyltransferase
MSMLLIGEKLNSSIPSTGNLMRNADIVALAELAKRQLDAGADALDINTAASGNEREMMLTLCALAGDAVMVDSASPEVLAEAARAVTGRGARCIVNSVTCRDRLAECAPFIAETGSAVVLMPIAERVPETVDEAVGNVLGALDALKGYGITADKVYVDVLIRAIAVEQGAALFSLGFIDALKRAAPDVKTIAGCSNVSFGLPKRALINRAFLAAAMLRGLDAAITDPCADSVRETVAAARALTGEDEDCIDYIGFTRGE